MNWNWTLIVSVFAAIFYLLQWLALEKQNKQNLFKLRIEHYLKIEKIVKEFEEVFPSNYGKTFQEKVTYGGKEIADFKEKLFNIKTESKFLFSKEVFDFEDKYYALLGSFTVEIIESEPCLDITPEKFSQLKEMNILLDSLFEKYLKLI